jgi:hypothetical protein
VLEVLEAERREESVEEKAREVEVEVSMGLLRFLGWPSRC